MLLCPGCPAHLPVLRRAPQNRGAPPSLRARAYILRRVGQSTPTACMSPIEPLIRRPTRVMPRTPPTGSLFGAATADHVDVALAPSPQAATNIIDPLLKPLI